MENLIALDYVFLAIMIIAVIRGVLKGFVQELTGMAAIGIGLVAAVLFTPAVAGLLAQWIAPGWWNSIAAFIIILVIVNLIIKLVGEILENLVESIRLKGVDRLLGIVFDFIVSIAVVLILAFVLRVQPLIPAEKALSESRVLGLIERVLPGIQGRMGDGFQESIDEALEETGV